MIFFGRSTFLDPVQDPGSTGPFGGVLNFSSFPLQGFARR